MYYPDMKEYITFLFSLLDEFAENWSKSAYHGRVYGNHGLHLTTTRHGFPVMFQALPANVNEPGLTQLPLLARF